MKKDELKRETKSLLVTTEYQALNTKYVRKNIRQQVILKRDRLCDIELEMSLTSSCGMLVQKKYNHRHAQVASPLH